MSRSWCGYCGFVFYDSHREDNLDVNESAHLCEEKAQAIAMKKKYNLTNEDLK